MPEYRIYFNANTLDDALLKSYVTPKIVEETTQYVESVALSYGVTAAQIATPTPDIVRRLALYYAYFITALRKAQYSSGKDAQLDSFHLKARFYRELLDDLLDQLTAESFTGGLVSRKRSFPSVIAISRN